VNRFIEHSQVVTTINYNNLTGLHTLKITVPTAHKIKSYISASTSRRWVTDFNNRHSSAKFSLGVRWLTLIYWTRLSYEWISESSRVLRYDRRSVSQSVLEWSTHLGLMTRFLLLSDSCRFVDVGRFLWWEDGSVVYNCCWPSPEQLLSCSSPVGFAIIYYRLR
jgi:hypothetical protein